ncbi:MAG: ribonuclease H-like domain-containing protein [Spirochaetes bacterium]|nr:ribonuclease H-like domain-containing protein [Spirochaetota bacterium]
MIDRVFSHCPGIGPGTEERLRRAGVHTWDDLIAAEGAPLRGSLRERALGVVSESLEARHQGRIDFFTGCFPTREQWRILHEYLHRATFFDIETTGLSWYENHPTVITAFHRGELRTFIHGRNLDSFLDLAAESDLLVSFNGSCFDLPFLERTFSVPSIGAPHVDLRWVAYHAGYRGGLKSIEERFGIRRPREIAGVDGLEAVDLYYRWQAGDSGSLTKLVRYCCADVVSLYMIAGAIAKGGGKAMKRDSRVLFERVMAVR